MDEREVTGTRDEMYGYHCELRVEAKGGGLILKLDVEIVSEVGWS